MIDKGGIAQSMHQTKEQKERYWQNWDNDDAARCIDDYWVASEGYWRRLLVQDLKREFGENAPITEIGRGSGLICKTLMDEGIVTEKS
jgi:hypothetical protein